MNNGILSGTNNSKKRNRENIEESSVVVSKKGKLSNSDFPDTDILDEDVSSQIYSYFSKTDTLNIIWKVAFHSNNLFQQNQTFSDHFVSQRNDFWNFRAEHTYRGKGAGGTLTIIILNELSSSVTDSAVKQFKSPMTSKNRKLVGSIHDESNFSYEKLMSSILFEVSVTVQFGNLSKNFVTTFKNLQYNQEEKKVFDLTPEFYSRITNKENQTIFVAEFSIRKNFSNLLNRERQELGYIGIVNEAMTCYMNSMLQTLNIFGGFKRAIFQIPTQTEDNSSVALSLQRLFYDLIIGSSPASTNQLIKSFGWSKNDTMIQHDVQEFNLLLGEIMKKKLKGTPGEETFSNLFEGKLINYIECVNVDYKSEKEEKFSDLQLTVKVRKTDLNRIVKTYTRVWISIQKRKF